MPIRVVSSFVATDKALSIPRGINDSPALAICSIGNLCDSPATTFATAKNLNKPI